MVGMLQGNAVVAGFWRRAKRTGPRQSMEQTKHSVCLLCPYRLQPELKQISTGDYGGEKQRCEKRKHISEQNTTITSMCVCVCVLSLIHI